MKRLILAATAAVLLGFMPKAANAQEISFGVFYSSLAPYGQWVNAGGYGMCWRPVGMTGDWAPYTAGHWVWTDYGWTWVSAYPWGWAPFHFGRWVLSSDFGWIWVPGYAWAPAWVQWRWGGGYCGWAPLPPGYHFRLDVVIGPNDRDFGVGFRGWNFVRADEMGTHRYSYIERGQVPHLIDRTRNVTRLRFTSRGVFETGLTRERVETFTHRRINTVVIQRTNEIGRQRIVGNSIHIYSPAPFEPRFRNEEQVIRRERSYSAPERTRMNRPDRNMPQREMTPPQNMRQQGQAPRFERHRQDSVQPKKNPPGRTRGQAPRDRNEKQKGPGRHR